MNKLCIIGVGNAFRGDDGAGLAVARQLREMSFPGVTIMEQSGEGAALMEAWGDADRVIVVDAVSSGSEPGTIHQLELDDPALADFFSSHSTHAFGLAEAIELARQLDRLPEELVVYGIEGKSFALGRGLSPEVAAAAETVATRIAQELASKG